MKKLLFVFVIFPLYFFGQINPINFENPGVGSVWTWTVFENDDNPINSVLLGTLHDDYDKDSASTFCEVLELFLIWRLIWEA